MAMKPHDNRDLDNLKRLAQSMQAQKRAKIYGPSDYGGYVDINRAARRKNRVKTSPQKPSKIIQAMAGTDVVRWTDPIGNSFKVYYDEYQNISNVQWGGVKTITLTPRQNESNIIETKGENTDGN